MGTEKRHFSLSLNSQVRRQSLTSDGTAGFGSAGLSSSGALLSPIARVFSDTTRSDLPDVDRAEAKVKSSPKWDGAAKKDQSWIEMMCESQKYKKGYKEGLHPLALFLHHLAISVDDDTPTLKSGRAPPRLSLWFPDTIVWDKGAFPTWYYSDECGHLVRTNKFSLEDVQRRFKQGSSGKIVAVIKAPVGNARNSCKLVSMARLQAMLPKLYDERRPGASIQRFVEFRSRPCLLRCRWKRHANAMDIYYVIRHHAAKADSTDDACLVSVSEYVAERIRDDSNLKQQLDVQSVGGPLRCELSQLMDHIVSYLATFRSLLFEEFVCDFTRDKANKLWFLQVKAFVPWTPWPSGMVAGPGVWSGEPHESGDRARCGFCECSFQRCDMQYTLNSRQLHAMHDRLQHWNNPLSWSVKESVLLSRDATTYRCFPVCADCHELHLALEDVVDAGALLGGVLGDESARVVIPKEVDDTSIYPDLFARRESNAQGETLRIARKLNDGRASSRGRGSGISSQPSPSNPLSRSSSCPQFFQTTRERMVAAQLAKRSPPEMPEGWQLDLPRNATRVVMSVSKPTYLLRFRILLLIQINALSLQRLQDEVAEHGMLALSWTVFGMEHCVALPRDCEESPVDDVVFNAIGTQHVYARCHDDVRKCVDACPEITIFIVAAESGRRLGLMSVDLHHVVRNQIELHHFELPVRGLSSVLSFTATVGFTAGVQSNCEHFELMAHMGDLIYVPPAGVVIPEALPKLWQALVTGSSDVLQRSDL